MTQRQFAALFGVSQADVSRWEHGKNGMRPEHRARFDYLWHERGLPTAPYRTQAILTLLAERADEAGWECARIPGIDNGVYLQPSASAPASWAEPSRLCLPAAMEVLLGSPYKHPRIVELIDQVCACGKVKIAFDQGKAQDFGYPTIENILLVNGSPYRATVNRVEDMQQYIDYGLLAVLPGEGAAAPTRMWIGGAHRIGTGIAARVAFDPSRLQKCGMTFEAGFRLYLFEAIARRRLGSGVRPEAFHIRQIWT